jgi:hypothetical protein
MRNGFIIVGMLDKSDGHRLIEWKYRSFSSTLRRKSVAYRFRMPCTTIIYQGPRAEKFALTEIVSTVARIAVDRRGAGG